MARSHHPPLLSATVAPLGDDLRAGLTTIAALGLAFVQLAATHPQTRPRDLSASGRRDLLATLRRHELICSGIDLWIPPAHFCEREHADRAVDAVVATIELAQSIGRVPVSLMFPEQDKVNDTAQGARTALDAHAEKCGVTLIDYAYPTSTGHVENAWIRSGIDAAAVLARGDEPSEAVLAAGAALAGVRLSDLTLDGFRRPLDAQRGRLDIVALRVATDVIGFERAAVIDARQWHDPAAGIAQSVAAWQACAPPASRM
ncbi:MAG: hypothetical protein ACR2GY_05740 [Phycisphaerales bacterium]